MVDLSDVLDKTYSLTLTPNDMANLSRFFNDHTIKNGNHFWSDYNLDEFSIRLAHTIREMAEDLLQIPGIDPKIDDDAATIINADDVLRMRRPDVHN